MSSLREDEGSGEGQETFDEVFSWIENISKGNTKNPPQGSLNFITFRNPHSLQNVRNFLFFHDPYRIIMLFETPFYLLLYISKMYHTGWLHWDRDVVDKEVVESEAQTGPDE